MAAQLRLFWMRNVILGRPPIGGWLLIRVAAHSRLYCIYYNLFVYSSIVLLVIFIHKSQPTNVTNVFFYKYIAHNGQSGKTLKLLADRHFWQFLANYTYCLFSKLLMYLYFAYFLNNNIKPVCHYWMLKMCSLYFVRLPGTSIDLANITWQPSWIYAI